MDTNARQPAPKNGLEMPPAPPGRPPPVRMGACPARARWPAFALVSRCRRCARGRHKPGGRSALSRMACWRHQRKPANTPCTAARSAPLLLTLPPQGQSSFGSKASTRASAGRSPRFPTQNTLGWGRKRGLLTAISDWRSPRLAGCQSILHSADSAVLDQVIPVIYIYRNLAAVILTSC